MAMTQQAIVDAIQSILVGDSGAGGLNTITSGRIFEVMAFNDSLIPMLTHQLIDPDLAQNFVIDSITIEFQLDFYGLADAGTKATRAMADRAFVLLHRQPITITGYSGCQMLCMATGSAPERDTITNGVSSQDTWRITQRYKLFGTGS